MGRLSRGHSRSVQLLGSIKISVKLAVMVRVDNLVQYVWQVILLHVKYWTHCHQVYVCELVGDDKVVRIISVKSVEDNSNILKKI